MDFRKAKEEEKNIIVSMYDLVKGRDYCTWNEFYPTIDDAEHDISLGNLYCLVDGGELLGAVSVVSPNEMDGMECFKARNGLIKEIARVVVAPVHQGKGLAKFMVQKLLDEFWAEGVTAVHLSVASKNIPAYKTYERVGFKKVGEAQMYGGEYILMEFVFQPV